MCYRIFLPLIFFNSDLATFIQVPMVVSNAEDSIRSDNERRVVATRHVAPYEAHANSPLGRARTLTWSTTPRSACLPLSLYGHHILCRDAQAAYSVVLAILDRLARDNIH